MRKDYMTPRIAVIEVEPINALATSGNETVGFVEEGSSDYSGAFYSPKRFDAWSDDGEDNSENSDL